MKSTLCLFFVAVLCLPSYSQSCNPPAGQQYTSEVAPWAPGGQVLISFDPKGTGTGDVHTFGIQIVPDPSNAPPKFPLDQTITPGLTVEDRFTDGAANWNLHNAANGTSISFHQGSALGPGNWIVSATWPKATVNYIASDGKVHSLPVDATGKQAAAVTSYLPDWDAAGNRLTTAAAA